MVIEFLDALGLGQHRFNTVPTLFVDSFDDVVDTVSRSQPEYLGIGDNAMNLRLLENGENRAVGATSLGTIDNPEVGYSRQSDREV